MGLLDKLGFSFTETQGTNGYYGYSGGVTGVSSGRNSEVAGTNNGLQTRLNAIDESLLRPTYLPEEHQFDTYC